jgi:hypothetical protein
MIMQHYKYKNSKNGKDKDNNKANTRARMKAGTRRRHNE